MSELYKNKQMLNTENMAKQIKKRKKKKHKIRTKIFKFLLIVVFVSSIAWILNTKIGNFSVEGSDKYTAEDLKKVLITNSFYDNSVVMKIRGLIGYKIPKLAYIKSMDIELNGIYGNKIKLKEVSIAYQVQIGKEYYELDSDLVAHGITDKRNDKTVLMTGYNVKASDFPKALGFDKTDKSNINLLIKYTNSIDSLNLKSIDLKDGEITLKLDNISVKLGEDLYLEDKLLVFKDIYPTISELKGVLHLEHYKKDQKDYRFEKKVD